ncbi:MAG: hypothetical protein DDT41_00357 [candidate division WS2 bacterium]|nr:hypothetical protein [Candidatus Psychracetigena formicireducens]
MIEKETIIIDEEIISKIKGVIGIALEYENLTGGKRSLGITGEIGEILVSYHLGLQLLLDPLSKGYDAIDKDGLRVQIKTRHSKSRKIPKNNKRTGNFSKHSFDYALLGLLNNYYELSEVYKVDYDKLKPVLNNQKRQSLSLRTFKKLGVKIYQSDREG